MTPVSRPHRQFELVQALGLDSEIWRVEKLMTRSNYSKGLVIYTPPEQNRTLKLDDGRYWSSSEEGVVFFETGRYRYYTSGAWIAKLLNVLARATRVQEVGLRI